MFRLARHEGSHRKWLLREVWLDTPSVTAFKEARERTGEDPSVLVGRALQLYNFATRLGTDVVVLACPYGPNRGAECTVDMS